MKKKYKRLLIVTGIFCILSTVVFFILTTLKENISFFYTVSEAVMLHNEEKQIRIGGIVAEGSVSKSEHGIAFRITDFKQNINVVYKGILPPMFSERRGIVVQGIMFNTNTFLADTVFAKHDENYMPVKVK